MATPAPLVPATASDEGEITVSPSELRELRDELQRFMMEYRFGLQEVETKIGILRDEFLLTHDYNPIEHVSSRVKSPDSLVEKVQRKGIDGDFASIRSSITDIAGIRITCSFTADVYRLFDLLTAQDDVRVLQVKDYIAQPKPNGYKSLHAILEVPVFLSTGRIEVPVEVQFRTIAMDFWASLEHKIYYKYATQVPDELLESLKDAADTAAELDARMERLHRQIKGSSAGQAAPVAVREITGAAAPATGDPDAATPTPRRRRGASGLTPAPTLGAFRLARLARRDAGQLARTAPVPARYSSTSRGPKTAVFATYPCARATIDRAVSAASASASGLVGGLCARPRPDGVSEGRRAGALRCGASRRAAPARPSPHPRTAARATSTARPR